MVGTAVNTVRLPDARRDHVASTSNPGVISHSAPDHKAHSTTFTIP
jgi:hypothetical protein